VTDEHGALLEWWLSAETMCRCPTVQMYHMDCPGIKPGPPQREAGV